MYTLVDDREDFLIVDKHPGVNFHKGPVTGGITAIIREDLGMKELYTVHRLDIITSGLLVFAKSKEVAGELSRQFRQRLIEKYYIAISDRRPKKKQGLIKGDMEKARRGGWKLARTMNDPAITQFFSQSMGEGLRLYILKPHTGKTHQIRVALKSISAPVYGDPMYHKKEYLDKEPDRGYLHSYALRFTLREHGYEFVRMPDKGECFTSKAFREAIKQYEKPWGLNWPSL
jgi:tRNA pseudouridine32 synthase/23S rRNA pseudouridine746 synthase